MYFTARKTAGKNLAYMYIKQPTKSDIFWTLFWTLYCHIKIYMYVAILDSTLEHSWK